ncbi:MAG TPA: epoxide hydrolase N-terminal domain-containing protein, partial [Puia sp.]|nr:epoxide hydrolase N-terminal domain-containing protein [Puia sp.]
MQIKPFQIEITDSQLYDLQHRLDNTRWPEELPGTGWERGIPVAWLRRMAGYWRHQYDWRKQEALLNRFPQFTATIDGQTIHFLHIRSREAGAKPLIITHGYPSSIVEFIDLIGPLTDPRAHGGRSSDAFHLVIPSL